MVYIAVTPKKYEITTLDAALERIFQLEEAAGLDWQAPRILGLTRHQEKFLGAIVHGVGVVTKDHMYTLMYGMAMEPPEIKILDVWLCKVRLKLAVHGITIDSMWGRGWFMSLDDKRKILDLYSENDPPRSRAKLQAIIHTATNHLVETAPTVAQYLAPNELA